MSTDNSTPGILVSKYSFASLSVKVLVLLLISIGMHESELLAQTRQQILEKRKAMSVDKSIRPHRTNVKPNSQLLRPNGTLCDFTLTPANASNNTLTQIIQSLVGNGITVSNVQTNLPATSDIYGSFSCGTSVVGIESGLILTSGSIQNVNMPNSFSGFTTENHLPGDTLLLARLTDSTGYDASIVSFDIVSNTNKISFQYVFASDEYNEFVGSEFNDVFGFFISGPGIATNIGINGTQNIALVPNSAAPISINTVNNNLNSQYYINNEFEDESDTTRFYHLEYDGLTTVLTATATVQPGTKYTITLAIEDVADMLYDCGVFIKGGSFTSGSCTPSVSIAANPGNTICAATNVTFTATPTNGGATSSYQWKLNGANVGTNSNTYQNAALTNNAKITCVMTSSLACANPTTATSNEITMTVTSSVAPSVSIASNPTGVICGGTNVTFTATPTNGGATPSYQWKLNGTIVGTNSNTYQNAALANSAKITCVMTSALACANPKTDTSNQITMSVSSPPLASIIPTGSLSFCLGKSVLLSANTGAGYIYQWKKGGVNIAGAIQATYTATIAGVYTVVVSNATGCSITSAAITVAVNPIPIATVTAGGPLTFCTGKNVLLKAYAGAGYIYQWKKAGVNIAGATLANYTATVSGVYTVLVTNAAGCSLTSAATTVVVNPIPIATVTAGGPLTFCTGKNVLLKAYAGAGYIYQWKKAGVNITGDTLANYTATVSGVYTVVVTNAVGCSITSAAITVVVNPLPIATVTAGGPLTFCTGKNVLLKAYAGAGYKYQWKKAGVNITGDTLANYTATVSGVYTVLVTNAAGCSLTSAATTVVVNPLPIATVTAGGPLTFCTGKNVLLKAYAGAGYKYQWKKAGVNITGDTLANYTATVSGVYTVVVTNAVGCSITSAAITVVVNPLPIATVTAGGPLTFCTGKNVLLKAYAGAGYKYQWKKAGVNIAGDTLANYTATVSGVYTVVVTNAVGCSITSAAITVVVNPLPIATVTAGGPLTFCTGKNVLLKAYAGAGYKYQWKKAGVNITGDTLANYTATVSGVYTVVVTNAVGCSITSAAFTVVVNPLPIATVTAGGPLTFCTGKNVLLKAYAGAGYKYQWKKAGVNITGDTLANYTATVSGVYTVVVTNAVGCSITSAAITVVVNPLPIATVTAGGPLTFCTGKNVLLKAYAGAGYKYQWKKAGVNITGDTLANYTATVSGVYTVVVTNAVGCSITSAAFTVVVNPLPIATVTAGGPLTFCTGKNVLLKAYAGAGYKYQWKKAGVNITGDTLANYTATVSGVYTVLVTNAVGCSITSAAFTVVVNPLPIATITPGGPLTFPVGGNVLLNASAGVGNTYQWKKDGINIIGATAAAYTATTSGTYTVIITNSNLCQATSQPVQVSVSPAPAITKGRSSFRQAEKDQMNPEPVIKVFPNPLHGDEYLNFEWNISNADKGIQVTVFDISGRKIESRFLNSSGKKLRINGVSGIYMVEIRWGKNERKIFRIIKF